MTYAEFLACAVALLPGRDVCAQVEAWKWGKTSGGLLDLKWKLWVDLKKTWLEGPSPEDVLGQLRQLLAPRAIDERSGDPDAVVIGDVSVTA